MYKPHYKKEKPKKKLTEADEKYLEWKRKRDRAEEDRKKRLNSFETFEDELERGEHGAS